MQTTPPGCENIVYLSIDDYKLEGIDKLYLSEISDSDKDDPGTEFEI